MEMRVLGASGLKVSPLMFGGNVFGWTVDEDDSFRLLSDFAARGFNFVDTADVYSRWYPGNSGGESETIIGRWLKKTGRRDQMVIATKVGMEMGPEEKGLRKGYILKAVEASLKRLQTDYIDLYQAHIDDPDTALEETLEAFGALVSSGKVRFIGASNYKAERLGEALRLSSAKNLPAFVSLQPHYNLDDRAGFERELEPVCRERKLGVIPYFSLASGFLTAKYRSPADVKGKAREDRVSQYFNERGYRILDALRSAAQELEVKPAAVALAWLLAKPVITAPIVSATTLEQLAEISVAATLKLSPSMVAKLDTASRY